MRVLVVNAGSSSLKLRLLDDHDVIERGVDLPAVAGGSGTDGSSTDELSTTLSDWPTPDAVGHRIVHGGTEFTGAVRVQGDVERQLRDLTDLAPLHQPPALAALDAVTARLPDVPTVACFDTAFHASIPAAAATYAIPLEWRQEHGIRRYGFHGLSHAYASSRAAEMLRRPTDGLRVVTCHLGAGASLAAVLNGRSVDTTMGFTPLEGLVMATRSGTVDPGALLWLQAHGHLSAAQLSTALEERSGILALGGSADMRNITAAARRGEPGASLALDVYVHRLASGIAAMTAAIGGLDALVFTGGVGENSATVRQLAADKIEFLGVAIDADRNVLAAGDTDVSAKAAGVGTLVIAAREDLQIAHETRDLLSAE